jgi:hypothetical protein
MEREGWWDVDWVGFRWEDYVMGELVGERRMH